MAFHERILPIFEATDTRLWLESWERFEALQAAYAIDQSRYAHLDTFDELASRNAGRLFEQMEFE